MQDLMDKIKASIENLKNGLGGKKDAKSSVATSMSDKYEINLVPEVKLRMIRAQKIRNLVLFICIVVAIASVSVVGVLFSIKSGQDIAMATQDGRLEKMSKKLNEYADLDDLIIMQEQLAGLSKISENKKILSRVFGALGVMVPQGGDTVKMSELRVNLTSNTLTMEAQADAGVEPFIDYRVLESFKKSASLTKYDYGRYVDARSEEIPSRCIKETDENGNALKVGENYYAWWDLTIDGCQAVAEGAYNDIGAEFYYSADAEVEMGKPSQDDEAVDEDIDPDAEGEEEGEEKPEGDQEGESGDSAKEVPMRVKIWRTPQFNSWYEKDLMSLDGSISGIEHFNSACFNYSGTEVGGSVRWLSTNECNLLNGELEVTSSSNARNESDTLVLRFDATVDFVEDFFLFKNKHMIAIGPTGQNVTDSFVQIQGMFTQEAKECEEDDEECLSASRNSAGGGE